MKKIFFNQSHHHKQFKMYNHKCYYTNSLFTAFLFFHSFADGNNICLKMGGAVGIGCDTMTSYWFVLFDVLDGNGDNGTDVMVHHHRFVRSVTERLIDVLLHGRLAVGR